MMVGYQTRVYIRGVFAAFIGGAATAVSTMIVDPTKFNLFQGGAVNLGEVAVVSGIVSLAMYLKQHPLPDPEKDTDAQVVVDHKVAMLNGAMTGTGDGSIKTPSVQV